MRTQKQAILNKIGHRARMSERKANQLRRINDPKYRPVEMDMKYIPAGEHRNISLENR